MPSEAGALAGLCG